MDVNNKEEIIIIIITSIIWENALVSISRSKSEVSENDGSWSCYPCFDEIRESVLFVPEKFDRSCVNFLLPFLFLKNGTFVFDSRSSLKNKATMTLELWNTVSAVFVTTPVGVFARSRTEAVLRPVWWKSELQQFWDPSNVFEKVLSPHPCLPRLIPSACLTQRGLLLWRNKNTGSHILLLRIIFVLAGSLVSASHVCRILPNKNKNTIQSKYEVIKKIYIHSSWILNCYCSLRYPMLTSNTI